MNKLIKGDSLEALQAMDDDSVDLIYIDPPYYFDTSRKGAFNYNSDFELNTWIELMRVRLVEAKRVMNDTSIIFISINEDGMPYLRILGNQVFGASNLVENFIWMTSSSVKNDSLTTSKSHEYVITYAKNKQFIEKLSYFRILKEGFSKAMDIYTKARNQNKTNAEIQNLLKDFYKSNSHLINLSTYKYVDDLGIYRKGPLDSPTKNKKTYDILHPVTRQPCKVPSKGWRFAQESMQKLLDQNRITFGEDHTTVPSGKYYLEETKYEPARSVLLDNSTGKEDLLKLFDEPPFAFAKPLSLIKTLIAMHPRKDIKVLDFFAGSGTTGHAVMELNKLDGGTRSFTLVEQMDYAEDITLERLVRAKAKYGFEDSLEFIILEEASDE